MSSAAFQQRELTLMFTDIVGYSRLMGRDQAQTISMLEDYRRILVEQIAKQQGTVIEFIGDAVFARFDTPQAAVNAAVSIQKELFTFNHFRDKSLPRLQTRIGLHTGEVATKGDAVFGDDVNIAARLEPIAVADGICISKAVYDAVKENVKEPILSLGVQPLKNIESKIRAYLIRPLGITFKTRVHYFNLKLNQKLGAYRYPIAASVLAVIVSLFYLVPRWLVPGYDANYVEIADFQNLMNTGGEADYLSSGITEAVRSQLADVRDVYLVKSGEGILAPVMLEGSVQKVGDNLRIAYQLIRRKDKVQIAGGKLDGAYKDIFILQDRVVAEIAKYLAEEFGLPNFRPARIDFTSDVLAYDYYMRGLEWLNRSVGSETNMDEAIKFFTTALVHDENFVLAKVGLCSAYGQKFDATRVSDLLTKGERYCNEAFELNSTQPEVLAAIGEIYRLGGETKKAIPFIKKALEYEPDSYEALLNLGAIYRFENAFDDAVDVIEKAIQLQPRNWVGYNSKGIVYMRSGEFEKAIQSFQRALDVTPQNTTLLNNIGGAYYYLESYEKAGEFFEKAVSLEPDQKAYSNAGTTYYYAKNYEKAKEMFKEAVILSPSDYRWYLNLAEAYRKLGESTLSVFNYRKSIELNRLYMQKNPNDFESYMYMAISNFYTDDLEMAYQNIKIAEQLAPVDVGVKYAKLRIWIESKTSEEIFSVARELIGMGYSFSQLKNDPDLEGMKHVKGFDAFKDEIVGLVKKN